MARWRIATRSCRPPERDGLPLGQRRSVRAERRQSVERVEPLLECAFTSDTTTSDSVYAIHDLLNGRQPVSAPSNTAPEECVAQYALTEEHAALPYLSAGLCEMLDRCSEHLEAFDAATQSADIRSIAHVASEYWDETPMGAPPRLVEIVSAMNLFEVWAYLHDPTTRVTSVIEGAIARIRYGVSLMQGAPYAVQLIGLGTISNGVESVTTLLSNNNVGQENLLLIERGFSGLAETLPSPLEAAQSEALLTIARLGQWQPDDAIGLAPMVTFHMQVMDEVDPVDCSIFQPLDAEVFDTLGIDAAEHSIPSDAATTCAPVLQAGFAVLDWMDRGAHQLLADLSDVQSALSAHYGTDAMGEMVGHYLSTLTLIVPETAVRRSQILATRIAALIRLEERSGRAVPESVRELQSRLP